MLLVYLVVVLGLQCESWDCSDTQCTWQEDPAPKASFSKACSRRNSSTKDILHGERPLEENNGRRRQPEDVQGVCIERPEGIVIEPSAANGADAG